MGWGGLTALREHGASLGGRGGRRERLHANRALQRRRTGRRQGQLHRRGLAGTLRCGRWLRRAPREAAIGIGGGAWLGWGRAGCGPGRAGGGERVEPSAGRRPLRPLRRLGIRCSGGLGRGGGGRGPGPSPHWRRPQQLRRARLRQVRQLRTGRPLHRALDDRLGPLLRREVRRVRRLARVRHAFLYGSLRQFVVRTVGDPRLN